LRLGQRSGQLRQISGGAIHGVRIHVELGNPARSRIAEPGVKRAVELPPEVSSYGRNQRDLRHQKGFRSTRANDGDRSVDGGRKATQKCPAIAGEHLHHSRRHETSELVPFEIQRPRIVGLELEPASLEAIDLAGDPIAVGQVDEVGLSLGMNHRHVRHGDEDNRHCSPQVQHGDAARLMKHPRKASDGGATRSSA
jgi:hypothetical protein